MASKYAKSVRHSPPAFELGVNKPSRVKYMLRSVTHRVRVGKVV
jgi:hypothetical protein